MPSPPSISIVIPVFNGGESFKACLKSIPKSLRTPNETIVVSDGDTDGSWEVAKLFGAKVIRSATSKGPAHARNLGAQAAQGDILFFIDADVTLHPNTLSLVEQHFQKSPNLTALIGSYDDQPGADNFLSQYKNLFHHYTHQVSSNVASTFWGACGAIRRSAFEAVGGFDVRYRKPCIEDIELGYRLKQAGYTTRLCKDVQVKHLKRWEPLSLLKAEIFYRALPWTALILQNRRLDNDLNLSVTNRLSVISSFALIASVIISIWMPWLLIITTLPIVGLITINLDLYRFFYRKRGLLFMLRVVPWHWFYFFYGGVAFGVGLLRHALIQPLTLNRFQLTRFQNPTD